MAGQRLVIGNGREDRWHAHENGATPLVYDRKQLIQIETRQEQDLGAQGDAGVHHGCHAERVEER